MDDVLKKIKECRAIPVVAIEDEKKAIPLSECILSSGLNVVEITFRTEAAPKVIEILKKEKKDLLVGAGTILNVSDLKLAIEKGASFIVSPGLNEEVVSYCKNNNILCIPGVATPSEVMKAYNMGIEYVKFFPSEAMGGIKYIDSISACFKVNYMPTGGININNLPDYLQNKKVFAVGGTWVAKKDAIENEEWDKIRKLCKEAYDISHR